MSLRVAAAVALAVLGVVVWRLATPAAGKSAEAVPTFRPAEGWNMLSTGIDPPPPRAPETIASNVPFVGYDQDVETANGFDTANELTGEGVVIDVTLYDRDGRESGFPARSLPFQLSDATLSNGFEGVSERIANERIAASFGKWDVDVMVFFGTNPPTQAQLDAAQEELDRLVMPTD